MEGNRLARVVESMFALLDPKSISEIRFQNFRTETHCIHRRSHSTQTAGASLGLALVDFFTGKPSAYPVPCFSDQAARDQFLGPRFAFGVKVLPNRA